jgi:hypothetical protein
LIRSSDLLEIVPLAPSGLAFGWQLVKQVAAFHRLVVVHVAGYRDGKNAENLDGVGRLSRRFENNPVDPTVDGDAVAGGNRNAGGGDDQQRRRGAKNPGHAHLLLAKT